jgi:hypothetical protein
MGSRSADVQRRSLDWGLSGRLGARRRLVHLPLHFIHILSLNSSPSYTHSYLSVTTPSLHSLLPIHSHGFPAIEPSPKQRHLHTNHTATTTRHHHRISGESPRSSNPPSSGSVVTTSLQIAAASASSLPARAAHLFGWIHRLRPLALRACPCTQHSTQHPAPSTPSGKPHIT